MNSKLYRVRNWDRHFEGAKSKTYNNKTSCSIPCKHGLGYKKLVKSKNGPALFGAWCAMIQVLSRHNKPRGGYCTNDGLSSGTPYSPDDLELLTDIPSRFFADMLKICSSKVVGWVDVTTSTDTEGDCEGTILPLNSDLDSNLDLDLNSDFERVWALYLRKGNKQKSKEYWKRLSVEDKESIESKIPSYLASQPDEKFRKDFQGWINPSNRKWEDKIIGTQTNHTPSRIEDLI